MGAITGYGSIFGLYILGAIVWSLAVIWILFDADRHYNAGCLWVVFTLIAPFIALPVYLLMRMSVVRSGGAEHQADLDREERIASRSPVARFRQQADGSISRVPGSWEEDSQPTTTGFTPFNPHRELLERAAERNGQPQPTQNAVRLRGTQAGEPPF